MHYSMVKLPEKPMMPRLFDERVGYFSTQSDRLRPGRAPRAAAQLHHALAAREEGSERRALRAGQADRLLRRSRRRRQVGAVSEEGASRAGSRRSRRPDSRTRSSRRKRRRPKQDPDWSPEDARYSVIRWLPSTIENASGPHVHDPRTGEILEADIQFYHNVMNLARTGTSCRSAPLDPRAGRCRCPTI